MRNHSHPVSVTSHAAGSSEGPRVAWWKRPNTGGIGVTGNGEICWGEVALTTDAPLPDEK